MAQPILNRFVVLRQGLYIQDCQRQKKKLVAAKLAYVCVAMVARKHVADIIGNMSNIIEYFDYYIYCYINKEVITMAFNANELTRL